MRNLFDALIEEGLLDDFDSTLATGVAMAEEDIIKNWAIGGEYKAWKQKKGWILVGNFKLSSDDEIYKGPKIKRVHGNFAIYNTKLKNLEGIFLPDAEIQGTITIEDNANLTSIKGLPIDVKSITITGNKKLKDIDTLLNVDGNAFVSKNGKKFTKDELASKLNVRKNIFCSVEPYDILVEAESLMEAFKAPQLKIVYDAIKKVSKEVSPEYRASFNDITRIEWDKLDASYISEIDAEDPNCSKMIRQYTSLKISGLFVMMNKKGEPLRMYYGKRYTPLHPKLFGWRQTEVSRHDISRYEQGTTDIIRRLSDYKDNDDLAVDTVMFIQIPSGMHQAYALKRGERNAAQYGALALRRGQERTGEDKYGERINTNDVRYYQRIADENRERYKKMLTKLRASRATNSNTFNNLKTRLDKAFDRYTALLSKVMQNPTKYDSWDIKYLNEKFHSISTYGSGKYSSYTSKGLFPLLASYMDVVIDAANGKNYGSKDISTRLKEYETSISEALIKVENKLSELEAK